MSIVIDIMKTIVKFDSSYTLFDISCGGGGWSYHIPYPWLVVVVVVAVPVVVTGMFTVSTIPDFVEWTTNHYFVVGASVSTASLTQLFG